MTLPGKCKDNFQMECKDPLVRGGKIVLKICNFLFILDYQYGCAILNMIVSKLM